MTRICLFALAAWLSGQAMSASEGFILGFPTRIDGAVNTAGEEMGPSLSSDGLSLYFTRGIHYPTSLNEDGTERTSDGLNNDIYVSTRATIDSPWGEPSLLEPPINDSFWEENSPDISADGQELVFADGYSFRYLFRLHHRDGGLGRADLWSSRWDADAGAWGDPENLGPVVNSEYEDFAPSLSADRLSLYFTSYRPDGLGSADIWVAHRASADAPWGAPENLGPQVNSSTIEQSPSISTDGSLLFFSRLTDDFDTGNFNLYVSVRDEATGAWGAPINLGSDVSSSVLEVDPEISHDGSALYFVRRFYTDPDALTGDNDIWEAAIRPLQPVSLAPGVVYSETFDDALGVEPTAGSSLPQGWTTTDSGVVHENSTSTEFPPPRLLVGETINAGLDGDADRALAVGIPARDPHSPSIQFLSEIDLVDSAAMRLDFSVETWAAEGRASDPGEPSFDVFVEVDSGDGFSLLFEYLDVGGDLAVVPPNGGGLLDGNAEQNRTRFASGTQIADLPQGTKLRIRWELPEESDARGWVFGIDDFELQLFDTLVSAFDCSGDGGLGVADADCTDAKSLAGTLASANLALGDLDGDGAVALEDFVILKEHFGASGLYSDGDLNLDGVVRLDDFVLFKSNFGRSASAVGVPEPGGLTVVILACAAYVGLQSKYLGRYRIWEASSVQR